MFMQGKLLQINDNYKQTHVLTREKKPSSVT